MNKHHIAIVAGLVAGYYLANRLNTYPVFSQAYNLGASLKG